MSSFLPPGHGIQWQKNEEKVIPLPPPTAVNSTATLKSYNFPTALYSMTHAAQTCSCLLPHAKVRRRDRGCQRTTQDIFLGCYSSGVSDDDLHIPDTDQQEVDLKSKGLNINFILPQHLISSWMSLIS